MAGSSTKRDYPAFKASEWQVRLRAPEGGESPLFTRDYYPLTPWSVDPARLLAFQFHDPSSGQGIVQVFSGPTATERSASLTLRGLDPLARYAVTHWDDPDKTATFTFCFRSISA